jgi:DNA-3-methyladenine glycosylase
VRPFASGFFRRPAQVVAVDLLGATIISSIGGRRTAGLIVEIEAYLGRDDPASHAYRGRRHAGNVSLYGPPGTWYVYRSYGVHWCANLVCGGPAAGGAVLLRGIAPLEGIGVMRRRRGPVAPRRLADGPGKLCQALGITRKLDGLPMRGSPVRVGETPKRPAGERLVTPRIGITKATDWPLRFVLRPSAQ